MKRELIITIIIVIIIIISGILTQKHTEKEIGDIDNKIESLKESMISREKSNDIYLIDINSIYDDWLEKDQVLSYYLEHNELEKVNTSIRTAKGFIEAKELEESIAELETCLSILEHIKEKQEVSLKNIF